MSPQHAPYDPVKAHKYYEEHKNLKGRKPPIVRDPTHTPGPPHPDPALIARVHRLKSKVSTLAHALSVAEAELSSRRQAATKKKAANSDGKSTAAQKKASKEYRDKHKTALSTKAKKAASSSSGGSSSSSSSSSNSVSSMSTEALGARVIKIKSALSDARSQLSSATQQLGQLTHSAIASDPQANAHFAQFRSERIPS